MALNDIPSRPPISSSNEVFPGPSIEHAGDGSRRSSPDDAVEERHEGSELQPRAPHKDAMSADAAASDARQHRQQEGRVHKQAAATAAAQQWMSTGGLASTSESATNAQLARMKQMSKPSITVLSSSVDLASILM
jgi:hypothetical protein